MSAFKVSRADGRSNAEVLIDLVKQGEPGRVYTYEEIGAALEVGTDTSYPKHRVQGIVRESAAKLSKQECRALRNVVNVGYKLAFAYEHVSLAEVKTHRADKQLKAGLTLLRGVRWDELDDTHTQIHRGTLMIMEAMVRNQQAMWHRQNKTDAMIAALVKRVEAVEQ